LSHDEIEYSTGDIKIGQSPHKAVLEAIESGDDGKKSLCNIISDGLNTSILWNRDR